MPCHQYGEVRGQGSNQKQGALSDLGARSAILLVRSCCCRVCLSYVSISQKGQRIFRRRRTKLGEREKASGAAGKRCGLGTEEKGLAHSAAGSLDGKGRDCKA